MREVRVGRHVRRASDQSAHLDFILDICRVRGMLSRSRRPSAQTMKVLETLAADSSAWRYGYELGLEVGLRSGSLYPILVRLCDRGLLEAKWEDGPPAGRPPRHLYRLTSSGLEYGGTCATRSVVQRPSRGRPKLRGAS